MVLRGDCTCSSVKSNCIFFLKGYNSTVRASTKREEALALPALEVKLRAK